MEYIWVIELSKIRQRELLAEAERPRLDVICRPRRNPFHRLEQVRNLIRGHRTHRAASPSSQTVGPHAPA
jgi:hypothetical protein